MTMSEWADKLKVKSDQFSSDTVNYAVLRLAKEIVLLTRNFRKSPENPHVLFGPIPEHLLVCPNFNLKLMNAGTIRPFTNTTSKLTLDKLGLDMVEYADGVRLT